MDRFRARRRTYIHDGIPQDRSIPNDYPSSNINRVWTNIDLPPRRPRVARRNSSDSSIDRLVRGFLRSFSYFVFFLLEYFCIRSTNSPKSILLRDPLRAAPRDRCICDREKGEYDNRGIRCCPRRRGPFPFKRAKKYTRWNLNEVHYYPKASRRA